MKKSSRFQLTFWTVTCMTAMLYLFKIQVNDIWTENESFYAEAVREMFERNNFIDITYNYAPRFQKPPLTYWLIAASTKLFGMNELAIRLPIVLLAFGTALLTWSMTKRLYGEKTALLAFVMEAISIQVVAGKHYASPEIPLLFFFTLTLWLFLKWELTGKKSYISMSAVALGLTVLTKGYPYLVVITGIMALYLLLQSKLEIPAFVEKLRNMNPPLFVAIVALTGLGWYAVMFLRNGEAYMSVLNRETIERAVSQKSSGIVESLLFYPGVMMWSFFPYSTILPLAIPYYIAKPRKMQEVLFAVSWFLVMLVVFTAAKGKLPTYFIQANPALAILCSHFIMSWTPKSTLSRSFLAVVLILPALAGIVLSAILVKVFGLSPLFYALPTAALLLLSLPFMPSVMARFDETEKRLMTWLQPFFCTFSALFIIGAGVMPALEQKRPYDAIGASISQHPEIPAGIPLYLQDGLLHNLPFYARHKVVPDAKAPAIFRSPDPVLALVRSESVPDSLAGRALWRGEIYRKRSSESRLLIFIDSYLKSKRGINDGFISYSLVYTGKSLPSRQIISQRL
jgi:4-amino-4-deoxy-L-arabinose transferase-like glycosyltransferase